MIKKAIKYILRAITIVLVVGICGTGIYQAFIGLSSINIINAIKVIIGVAVYILLCVGVAKLFIWAWED